MDADSHRPLDDDSLDFLDRGPLILVRLEKGQTIDRYIIQEEIGRGGSSRVYRAIDPRIDRPVAIKMLTGWAIDEGQKRRFLRELRSLGKFQHPAIVRLYDCSEQGGVPYLVTELLEGEDLATAIEERHLTARATQLDLSMQIAVALDYVHAHRLTHGDIKPGNVFINTDGRAVLLDLGLAEVTQPDSQRSIAPRGTPGYLAPEILAGEAATERTDLYSFGLLLFELFTGERAFPGNMIQALYKTAAEPVPEQPLIAAGVPDALRDLIRLMTAKEPNARPSLRAVIDTIAAVQEGRTAPPLTEASRWSEGSLREKSSVGRKRSAAFVVAGLVVLVGAAWAVTMVLTSAAVPRQAVVPSSAAGPILTIHGSVSVPQASSSTIAPNASTPPSTDGAVRETERAAPPAAATSLQRDGAARLSTPPSPAAALPPSTFPPQSGVAPAPPPPVASASRADERPDGSPALSPEHSIDPREQTPRPARPSPEPAGVPATSSADTSGDQEAVRNLVGQLADAFRAKDIRAITRLWPTLDAAQTEQLAGAFSRARIYDVRLTPTGAPVVEHGIDGRLDTATVRAQRRVEMTPYSGPPPRPRAVEDAVVFYVERRSGNWVVTRVD